jgi:hypothetical protein
MGTNCAPLLVPLFVRDRLQSGASQEKRKKLARPFHYEGDVVYKYKYK